MPTFPLVEGEPRVYQAEELREIDRRATDEYAIPSLLLMENAALALAAVAAEEARAPRALVFCGPGNNGGDGLCAARHLHNRGFDVRIVLAAARGRFQGDAGVHLAIAGRLGLAVLDADAPDGAPPGVVIDALFGTGLSRPLEGAGAACARRINALRDAPEPPRVIATDVPSGLQSDTGEVLGDLAVRADVTVTFVGHKPAFALRPDLVGRVIAAPIGAPPELTGAYGRPLSDARPPRQMNAG